MCCLWVGGVRPWPTGSEDTSGCGTPLIPVSLFRLCSVFGWASGFASAARGFCLACLLYLQGCCWVGDWSTWIGRLLWVGGALMSFCWLFLTQSQPPGPAALFPGYTVVLSSKDRVQQAHAILSRLAVAHKWSMDGCMFA